jgi:hypothetical protein
MWAVGHHQRSLPVVLSGCSLGERMEIPYDQSRAITPAEFDTTAMSPLCKFATDCGLRVASGEKPIPAEIGIIELVLRGEVGGGKVDDNVQ